jgi:hypothetical protein
MSAQTLPVTASTETVREDVSQLGRLLDAVARMPDHPAAVPVPHAFLTRLYVWLDSLLAHLEAQG